MTPRTLIGLAAATAVVTAAAVVAVIGRYGMVETVKMDERAFPGLEERVNEIGEISITLREGALVMRRKGDQWTMSSRNDYPVRAEKVGRMLVQLSQLRLYEPKTKLPERYGRIEVEDITAENSKSKLLKLVDADGRVVLESVVGKEEYFMAGPSRRGVYLRKPGETQSWLATGFFELSKWGRDWVVRDIMDVASKRVQSVETVASDGVALVVAKERPGESGYAVEDLPAGAKLDERAEGKMRDMGSALAVLDLNDVFPAREVEFSGDKVTRAVVRTFDGLVVEATLMEKGEDVWATFRASVDESRLAAGGDNKDLKAPDEVRKEAEDVNRRVTGWAYRIPDYKGNPLRTKLSDLLAPEEQEKAS